jgi:hypothetical protein
MLFKQQHHPVDMQLFHKGANRDDDPTLVAFDKGMYVDAFNMRPTQVDGHAEAIEQIGGETLIYPNIDNRCQGGTNQPIAGNYTCIGVRTVQNSIVEFWADADGVRVPFVRVNGWIVLYPNTISDFPVSVNFPLQMDKNDSCVGGEVFCTDNNIPPFFFNVADLLQNAGVNPATNTRDGKYTCTQKYFSGFQLADYQIQLTQPLDHPVFVELVIAGTTPNAIGQVSQHGSGGKKVGSVQYSISYTNASGNMTPFSQLTPLIPIPAANGTSDPTFPNIKTYGGNPGSVSNLGVHIRFRVTNILNYTQVNVRRVSFQTGAAVGTPGVDEIIAEIPITNGEIGIIDFYDYDDSSISANSNESVSDTVSAIQAAKTLRYYNSRLYLMNITYANRDLSAASNQITFNNLHGNTVVPIAEAIGPAGYRDPYNDVYKKSYARREKYGFGLLAYDGTGGTTFTEPIPGATNFQMPFRRDGMGPGTPWPDSLNLSPTVIKNRLFNRAANTQNNVSQTFEVFDLLPVPNGGTATLKSFLIGNSYGILDSVYCNHVDKVFHPTGDTDSNVTEHIYDPESSCFTDTAASVPASATPFLFSPQYYALGMSFQGVNNMPSWIKAFSVVRTAPAGVLVCQGQSFYYIPTMTQDNSTKALDTMFFDSPDLYSGMVPIAEITNNLSNYVVELASALGFYTEVWAGYSPVIGIAGQSDSIVYARILQDNGNILYPDSPGIGIKDPATPHWNYTSFGAWRNSANPNFASSTLQYGIQNLNAAQTYGSAPRRQAYTIQTKSYNGGNTYPYNTVGTLGDLNYTDANVKLWHEPVYVVNIINPTQNVPNAFVQTYYETEAYVKVESIIGQGDGRTTQFYLVDERWEDCIPAINSYDPGATAVRFIYIKDSNNITTAWLNVTYMNSGTINAINTAIHNNGFYTAVQSNGNQVNVTGLYTHGNINNRVFFINFNQVDFNGNPYIPGGGTTIKVLYDSTAPITFFGGDTYISEYEYPIVDATYGSGDSPGPQDTLYMDRPFPYPAYELNPAFQVPKYTTGIDKCQNGELIYFSWSTVYHSTVRQMLVSGIVESKINTAMDFGDTYPHVNYVIRPFGWTDTHDCNSNDNKFSSKNNLFNDYLGTYYPGECANWGYGGFHILPSFNVDYSALPVNSLHYSKPLAGLTVETKFCSQVIWSEQRPVNEVNAPGLQSFPPFNVFDIGDETGEINFAWDTTQNRDTGNLYAITEHGISRLITENNLVQEQTGGTLAAIGSAESTQIQKAIWVTKTIGMPDETWRTAAEWDNKLYFMNKNSAYVFDGSDVKKENDIGDRKYKTIITGIINSMLPGYGTNMTSFYDQLNDEYWLSSSIVVKRCGFLFQVNNPSNLYPDGTAVTFYNGAPPGFPPVFEINNNDIIVVTTRYVINLVELTGVQNFYICNATASPIQVQVKTGPAISVVGEPTIQPGECYYFTAGTYPNYTAVLQDHPSPVMPIYSVKTQSWIGQFAYLFDRYTAVQNNSYGVRNIETYQLNQGPDINNEPLLSWVLGVSTGIPSGRSQGKSEGPMNMDESKEFIRIRVASQGDATTGVGKNKGIPQTINFFDSIEQFLAGQVQSSISNAQGVFYLKDYGAWEQYISRRGQQSYIEQPGTRMQGKALLYQITNTANWNSFFRITSVEIQSKNLV